MYIYKTKGVVMLSFLNKFYNILNLRQESIHGEPLFFHNGTNSTRFYLNDPTTPQLISEQDATFKTALPISSLNDKGGGFELGSLQQQASACSIMINNILSYMMVAYKTSGPLKTISKWAATNNLAIKSRAGVDINAYYDRKSLKFFYFKDTVKNKTVYACDSSSVVAHEFGHAFLDIMRPDFWSTQAPEIWAYHEAFGDITALIASLQYDALINCALEETNGNMMQSNVISRLASEMGIGLNNVSRDKDPARKCLRDLSAVFVYQTPESLPKSGPESMLINECHSFSRVFSGAFYEILILINKHHIALGRSPLDSIKISRDIMARYLLKATAAVPVTVRLFDALSRQILQVDQSEGGKYQEIIKDVFTRRKVLIQRVLMLDNANIDSVKKTISDNPYELHLLNKNKLLRTISKKTINLSKMDKKISILSNNPLLKLDIDVPSETGYYFDENNMLFDVVETTNEEMITAAYDCLEFLDKKHLVGSHGNALFEIKHGKLIRKQIVCRCGGA